jgi:long-chain fatty acid transport protein
MKRVLMAVALVGCLAAGAAATNGYFQHGYGPESKSMAGANTAIPMTSITSFTNPAVGVYLGTRYDIAAELFLPYDSYTITGAPSGASGALGLVPGKIESDANLFVMPHLGANFRIDDKSTAGVGLIAAGGMESEFPTSTFYGTSPTGVALMQGLVTASYSRVVTENHSVGISLLLGGQQFEATGLEMMSNMSADPTNVSNNGASLAFGYGARVGYLGRIIPMLSVGASFQSKIYMTEFDEYAGLFAEQGDFDIPATWNVGIALYPIKGIIIGVDVQQIMYSGVAAVGNSFASLLTGAQLGADKGPGFGWEDMTIVKVGAQWRATEQLALRAGCSYGTQPIPDSELMFNILAPAVTQMHVAVGGSWTLGCGNVISVALSHAIANDVSGPHAMEVPGQQTIKIDMKQWDIEIGFTLK